MKISLATLFMLTTYVLAPRALRTTLNLVTSTKSMTVFGLTSVFEINRHIWSDNNLYIKF